MVVLNAEPSLSLPLTSLPMISTVSTWPFSTSFMNSEKEGSYSDFVWVCRTTCHNNTAVTIRTTQKSNVLTVGFKEASKPSKTYDELPGTSSWPTSGRRRRASSVACSHNLGRNQP